MDLGEFIVDVGESRGSDEGYVEIHRSCGLTKLKKSEGLKSRGREGLG